MNDEHIDPARWPAYADARRAYLLGVARWDVMRARGARHAFHDPDSPRVQRHKNGLAAVAEFVVATMLGRAWLSADPERVDPHDGSGDVAGGVQVRHTRFPSGSLKVKRRDADPFFVLVTGEPVQPVGRTWPAGMFVVGWIARERVALLVEDGVAAIGYPQDADGGKVLVPQAALWPLVTLPPLQGRLAVG